MGLNLHGLLVRLCTVHPDRRPGSPGNDVAVDLAAAVLTDLGWQVECPQFGVVDWSGAPGALHVGDRTWPLQPSPYSLGWAGTAPIRAVEDEAGLGADHSGTILVLHGALAAAPLTPKDYPFYGSDRDARVVQRLERCGAVAVLAVTGRAPELAGSWDPFPLIEDGAFAVPTGNLRAADGESLLALLAGGAVPPATVQLASRRWPSTARNVVARLGPPRGRVELVAHIDSKPGTPGAVDNAAGVVILLRVAELLARTPGPRPGVEIVLLNGEDYYAASGEREYLASTDLSEVRLAVNVDGAGYAGSGTAYSTYGLDEGTDLSALAPLVPGPPWPQSDHMLFVLAGRPAIALTSSDMATVMGEVAHSPADVPDLVDPHVLEQAARAVAGLVRSLPDDGRGQPGVPG
jgi:aminopeptidase YwaD